MARLAAGSGCGRHIRTTEAACPFCGATATFTAVETALPVGRPLTRAAILFASATAIAGCGKTTDNLPAPAYGVPVPPDTVSVDAAPPPPAADAGMHMTAPAYGVPPPRLENTPPPGPPDPTKKK